MDKSKGGKKGRSTVIAKKKISDETCVAKIIIKEKGKDD